MSDHDRLVKNESPALLRREPLETQAALRDSAERLRAILQTAVEGIITIDSHGHIESFNPAAERIFGYSAAEVMGRNVSMLMPQPYREEHDAYLANYHRTGQARVIGIGREVQGQRKDGTVFPLELSVGEVRVANGQLYAGFVRDISERRRLEKEILEISEREKRRIGQDLHDGLGQHLAGIELLSQALKQRIAARSKADAARVGEISRHVRDAIVQTRQLARGLSPVNLESEGLMAALQELAASTQKMFRVRCHFACDTPVLVGDHTVATNLYRIAQEAVSNAIRHGKARHLQIQLTHLGDRHLLSVKDDGVGLPKNAAKARGMGLHIMKYRAGLIGGEVMVERDLEGGTSVICSAPARTGQPRAK